MRKQDMKAEMKSDKPDPKRNAIAMFAVPAGKHDWEAELISERPEEFEAARAWCEKQGMTNIHYAYDDVVPDAATFVRCLNI